MNLRRDVDTTMLLLSVCLICLGIVMVYSSSAIRADRVYGDGFYFLKRQLAFAIIGFLAMVFTTYFNYRNWRKLAVFGLILSVCLLGLLFVPGFGMKSHGALRWLRFPGFNLQPAELVKVALVMYLAHSLTRKKEKVRSFTNGYLPYMIVLAVLLALLVKQPDLGSAIIIASIAMVMLFVAGARWLYLFSTVLISLPAVYILVYQVEFRRKRILAFLDPWADRLGDGYQTVQSLMAFGNGGVRGQGLGGGEQKLFYLPEAHTDFIFSVIGEELGMIGVIIVASLFLTLVICGFRIALQCEDPFGRNLAFGLTMLLGLEAFVNLGVCMGLLPTKGLALPFLSYGGTSLVTSMAVVGILLNISSSLGGKR
ncbi:MAG: putative lipid II flippase FtsW [Desulfuromonas sp.]|nr:MAG: putative lipid II flippase FtsW [Desulfuromonas sp.]